MKDYFAGHLFPCAYKSLFGIDCPICGFQRAFLLLIHGDFIESIQMYAPLLPVLFLLLFMFIRKIKPTLVRKKILSYYSLLVLAIIIINYTIKMMLLATF